MGYMRCCLKFSPYRALLVNFDVYLIEERPIRAKYVLKVFGKAFGDYSPWDGEMSEGQRGQVPVRETFPQKGLPR